MSVLAALAALSLSCALAQQEGLVRRGDLQIKVKVTGTVTAADVFRLKSTVEGRVEAVTLSTNAWNDGGATLGILANKELAAVIDAHGRTGNDILEENWQRIYKPTKISCPSDCFVLKSFIKAGAPIKAQAILLEAAKNLRASGHVRLEDAHWVEFGQTFEFWAVKDPAKKMKGRIANFKIDAKGADGEPGGDFSFNMPPSAYFEPGTQWEGLILPSIKKNVLMVPTPALVRFKDALYLPVRVSTGVTTDESTEIVGGVEEGRSFVTLDASALGEATKHKYSADDDALRRRLLEDERKAKAAAAQSAAKKKEERDPKLGPDPYEE